MTATALKFIKASKQLARLRLTLMGPSGSGKTMTSILLAKCLGKRVAVIDTEHGSASKYADLYDFDTLLMDECSPEKYMEAIGVAESLGYDVIVIDSLSHEWEGKNGCLELKSESERKGKNSYTAWNDVTPLHRRVFDTICASKCHVIATMRTKTEYVLEQNLKGKMVPRKVGLAPIQRDGAEYEFDIVGLVDPEHSFTITKTRIPALEGRSFTKEQTSEFAAIVSAWLSDAKPSPTAQAGAPEAPSTVPAEPPVPAHTDPAPAATCSATKATPTVITRDQLQTLANQAMHAVGGDRTKVVAAIMGAAGCKLSAAKPEQFDVIEAALRGLIK